MEWMNVAVEFGAKWVITNHGRGGESEERRRAL